MIGGGGKRPTKDMTTEEVEAQKEDKKRIRRERAARVADSVNEQRRKKYSVPVPN